MWQIWGSGSRSSAVLIALFGFAFVLNGCAPRAAVSEHQGEPLLKPPASGRTLAPRAGLGPSPPTQWARTVSTGADNSVFDAVALGPHDDVFAAGYVSGNSAYEFGAGAIVRSGASRSVQWTSNMQPVRSLPSTAAVLVKYDKTGAAQWARWPSAGSAANSLFRGTAVDGAGDVFVAGAVGGPGTYDFGHGVSVKGATSHGWSAVLIKYNPAGVAQWAKTIEGPNLSFFDSVAIDKSGNLYVAGYGEGSGLFRFGKSVAIEGMRRSPRSEGPLYQAIYAKYDPSGTIVWARSVRPIAVPLQPGSRFVASAIDAQGDSYVVGQLQGRGSYDLNGIRVSTTQSSAGFLVKYSPAGTAQWVCSPTPQSRRPGARSYFRSVAVGHNGEVIVVGSAGGKGVRYDFGKAPSGYPVVVTAEKESEALVAIYSSSGATIGAHDDLFHPIQRSVGNSASDFTSVAVDGKGNIYAAGAVDGTAYGLRNAAVVKLNWTGNLQWVKLVTTALPSSSSTGNRSESAFEGITTAPSGNLFAVGYVEGKIPYRFGQGIAVVGPAATVENVPVRNLVLVNYRLGVSRSGEGGGASVGPYVAR